MLCLWSIRLDCVISNHDKKEQFYKEVTGKYKFHGHFPIIPL